MDTAPIVPTSPDASAAPVAGSGPAAATPTPPVESIGDVSNETVGLDPAITAALAALDADHGADPAATGLDGDVPADAGGGDATPTDKTTAKPADKASALDDLRMLALETKFGADVAASLVKAGDPGVLADLADRLMAEGDAGDPANGTQGGTQAEAKAEPKPAAPQPTSGGIAALIPEDGVEALRTELGVDAYTKGIVPLLASVQRLADENRALVMKLAAATERHLQGGKIDGMIDRLADDRYGQDSDDLSTHQRAARERLLIEAERIQQAVAKLGRAVGPRQLLAIAHKRLAADPAGTPSNPATKAAASPAAKAATTTPRQVGTVPPSSGARRVGSLEELDGRAVMASVAANTPTFKQLVNGTV